MANLSITTTVTGLQEFDFQVPDTANYNIRCKLQLPNRVAPSATPGAGGGAGTGTGGGPAVASQVVTVIKVNSSTKLTSNAGDEGVFLYNQPCTANDTIKVILTSSLAADNQPEAVQCTISISES
jgi:hypothetical protein